MRHKKTLLIEWRHFEKEGKTCQRCLKTGRSLNKVVDDLRHEYKSKGIEIKFKETKLPESKMPESNQILLNGISIEKLIPGAITGENECDSCSELIGSAADCRCRTISLQGKIFEELPADLIKTAVLQLLRLK